ncbi:flavodoxin [uncultured Faecalibaculum sp.]|uniref:flavodoxin family protein n=1 Tax=uncultured Faecalibaculum sp. TaxID=1729681 RepID=UPI00260A63BE|nr:hypothetical protein [uncultured Faecalibaculum sp.]
MGRRILALLLAALFLVAGCSSAPSEKSLVVYYSLDDGVEEIAEKTAKELDADLFEIETDRDFAELLDHEPLTVEEIGELRSDDFKLKQAVPDNWGAYSVIYFGFPIWYGEPAQPSQLFLMENNIKDKTWFPFTIASQKEAEKAEEILDSFGIRKGWQQAKGFSQDPGDADISAWITETRTTLEDLDRRQES